MSSAGNSSTRSVPGSRFEVAVLLDHAYGDHGHGTAAEMATLMEHTAEGSPWSQQVTHLGFGYPDDRSDPHVHRAAGEAVASVVGQSLWLVYIGHGGRDGWNISIDWRGVHTGTVAGFSNGNQLPVVWACGCETAPIIPAVPTSGERYQDEKGKPHQFGSNADNSRVWDWGANDPSSGVHARDWQGTAAQPVRITVPRPSVYDLKNRAGARFAAAWLFNSSGGAIAYVGESVVNQDNWPAVLAGSVLRQYRGPGTVLGDMWRGGQVAYWSEHRNDPTYDNQYGAPRVFLTEDTLYADPSLRLP